MSIRFFAIVAVSALVFANCERDDAQPVAPVTASAPAALIVVVESNDILPSNLVLYYSMFKSTADPVLAAVFGVPVDSLRPRTLSEIVELYGEDWVIGKIDRAARGKYKSVIILTDEAATRERFLEALGRAKSDGLSIDVLLDLHASTSILCFNGSDVSIDALTSDIKSQNIKIRALYQTVCYGSYHLPSWDKTGIAAVCGTRDVNSLSLFTPASFVDCWTSGMTFRNAVTSCTQREVDSLQKYDTMYGLAGLMMPSEQELYDSQQVFSGVNQVIVFSSGFLKRAFALTAR